MKKILSGLALTAMAVVITGCATPTTRIDTRNDRGPQVAGLDYRDLQEAASAMLQSLFRSGRLDRTDGQAYVMTVGKVKNDTPQRFDTDTLTSYITEELMNNGKVMVTSAMAATADNRDEMVNAARSVRGNAEFNQATRDTHGQWRQADRVLFPAADRGTRDRTAVVAEAAPDRQANRWPYADVVRFLSERRISTAYSVE